MTALRSVWLTTEDGDVVRADGLVGFHLRVVGSAPDDGPLRDPVDFELWATAKDLDRPVLVACEAAERAPALLGELIQALANAVDRTEPTLFVRSAAISADGGGLGVSWFVEPDPPTQRWRDLVFG